MIIHRILRYCCLLWDWYRPAVPGHYRPLISLVLPPHPVTSPLGQREAQRPPFLCVLPPRRIAVSTADKWLCVGAVIGEVTRGRLVRAAW